MRNTRWGSLLGRTALRVVLAGGLCFCGWGCHQHHYYYYGNSPAGCPPGTVMPSGVTTTGPLCEVPSDVGSGGTTISSSSALGAVDGHRRRPQVARGRERAVGQQVALLLEGFRSRQLARHDAGRRGHRRFLGPEVSGSHRATVHDRINLASCPPGNSRIISIMARQRSWNHTRSLVTGASSGLGKALAERLVHAGAPVILTGRSAERLAAVAQGLIRAELNRQGSSRSPPT